MGFSEHLFTKW